MHQMKFWNKERSSPRRSQEKKNNQGQLQDEPQTSTIRGSVAPGILSRFRRLFSSIRGFTGASNENSEDLFSYTPSQNPEEFLASLRNNQGEYDWNRCNVVEFPSVSSDTPKPDGYTRFVCISDTHSSHRRMKVPDGDVLLHCGDFTERGELREILDFNDWLSKLPHKHKVVIAGNHDIPFDRGIMEHAKESPRFRCYANIPESIWKNWQGVMTNCVYLEDSEITINGFRIYGSPWQPNFGNLAFNLKRGSQILEKWDKIPDDVDILMTHGPPAGRLDQMKRSTSSGCVDLLNTVQLRVKPKFHIFGHIHDAYGSESDGQTVYINSSAVNQFRHPVNQAFIFDLPNAGSSITTENVTDEPQEESILAEVASGNAGDQDGQDIEEVDGSGQEKDECTPDITVEQDYKDVGPDVDGSLGPDENGNVVEGIDEDLEIDEEIMTDGKDDYNESNFDFDGSTENDSLAQMENNRESETDNSYEQNIEHDTCDNNSMDYAPDVYTEEESSGDSTENLPETTVENVKIRENDEELTKQEESDCILNDFVDTADDSVNDEKVNDLHENETDSLQAIQQDTDRETCCDVTDNTVHEHDDMKNLDETEENGEIIVTREEEDLPALKDNEICIGDEKEGEISVEGKQISCDEYNDYIDRDESIGNDGPNIPNDIDFELEEYEEHNSETAEDA